MYHFMSTRYSCIIVLITTLLIPLALAENEVEKNKELEVGMVAPVFTLMDETGTKRNLTEFLGKKNVILAFYPKDFTGG